MNKQDEFQPVFERLRTILQPYAAQLTVKQETDEIYSLYGPYSQKYQRDLFFGSAQIKKNYVSFYLMPVYMYPELIERITLKLKKRMHGKSCFNFTRVDQTLFVELAGLTKIGFEKFQADILARS